MCYFAGSVIEICAVSMMVLVEVNLWSAIFKPFKQAIKHTILPLFFKEKIG
jgi:hypothetical protein